MVEHVDSVGQSDVADQLHDAEFLPTESKTDNPDNDHPGRAHKASLESWGVLGDEQSEIVKGGDA